MRVRPAVASAERVEVAALWAFAVAGAAAVIGVRPVHGPDSASYFKVDLLGRAERLWTVPAFYRLLPGDGWRLAGQTAVFVIAWVFCAWTVAELLEHRALRRLATVSILALGLATVDWNAAVLSESLATSLLVALVATWLRLHRRKTAANAAAFVVVAGLWTFTRQLDVVVAIPVFVAIAVVTGRRHRYPQWTAVGLMVVLLWGLGAVLLARGDRPIQRFNSMAILVDRFLPDTNARAYFQARGLALTNDERQFGGQFVTHESLYMNDSRLTDWVDHRFMATYGSYVASHPGEMASGATHGVVGMLRPVELGLTRLAPLARTWKVVWGRTALLALAVATAAATAASVVRHRFRWTSLEATGLAGALVAGWWLLAVWLLSATELGRLSVPAGVLLRLALVVLLVQAADLLLAPHRVHVVGADDAAPAGPRSPSAG